MSVFAAATPPELIELLSGDLYVCVDDAVYAATESAQTLGLTGPVVHMRLGVALHCMCDTWADLGACWHACDLRVLATHTFHQLRRANDWTDARTGKPFPAEIRKALGVASRLAGRNPRVWPSMLPDGVRPGSPGWGERA